MDDKTITVQHQFEAKHSQRYHRRNENLIQIQSQSVSSTNTIKLTEQPPMNPTSLYVSLNSYQSSSDILCFHQRIFLLFNTSNCNSCLWICPFYDYSDSHWCINRLLYITKASRWVPLYLSQDNHYVNECSSFSKTFLVQTWKISVHVKYAMATS